MCYTGCPTRYRSRHFFNHFTTNEDIATKFEAGLPHSVINVKKRTPIPFKFRCNIFIGVRIIKEMPGSVASGTPCIIKKMNIELHKNNVKSYLVCAVKYSRSRSCIQICQEFRFVRHMFVPNMPTSLHGITEIF